MRFIIGSHSKTPYEMLYQETSTIPLLYVIFIRRFLYFQTLVKIVKDELTHRVYNAQKSNSVKGDWIQYLKEDFEFIGEEWNEKYLEKHQNKIIEFFVKVGLGRKYSRV